MDNVTKTLIDALAKTLATDKIKGYNNMSYKERLVQINRDASTTMHMLKDMRIFRSNIEEVTKR